VPRLGGKSFAGGGVRLSPELTLVLEYSAEPDFEDTSLDCPACHGVVAALDVAILIDSLEPLCCRRCGIMLAA
jgi:hypothetical protein